MAINEWWANDARERYWLEITDREDLGTDLYAPQTDLSGKETWSYSLVRYVSPGDIVFHYWKQAGQEKAIVGRSVVAGTLERTTIRWQSHSVTARSEAMPPTRPAWRVALADYSDLEDPITLGDLRALESELRNAAAELEAATVGPLYLPFVFSEKRPLRTAQGYLAKMPGVFVDVLPGLGAEPAHRPRVASSRPRPVHDTGYQQDTDAKLAIERHAVDWALAYFEELGYLVDDVGSTQPFDVLAVADDHEVHVEVKGSSGISTTVELTSGEVNEAARRSDAFHALVVVDQILWTRDPTGSVATSGGRVRVWDDWEPSDDRLVPTRYRYLLPPGGEVA